MANPTMTLIASNTVGSGGVSSVTFSSIPATYTDLVLKATMREATYNGYTAYLSFNGLTTNRTSRLVQGNGSAAGSGSDSDINFVINGSSTTANTFSSTDIYIPNYTSSNFKSVSIDGVTEDNATFAIARLSAGLWSSTAAITSIGITVSIGNIAANSTFYLYGISNS